MNVSVGGRLTIDDVVAVADGAPVSFEPAARAQVEAGRAVIDRAVASALALAEVADAVGERGVTLVDGGLRSGLDVLAALALGAQAVCLGRPVIWGLAADGARGAAQLLRHVGEELVEAMRLAGARSRADVTRDLIWSDARA